MASSGRRTLFIYWGRRGALSQIALGLARVAEKDSFFSISRQNELFDDIRNTGVRLVPVETFEHGSGAVLSAWRLPSIRRRIARLIAQESITQVIVLMPHVWTPLVAPAIRRAGARYVVVVHDAQSHPGDRTGRVLDWLLRDAAQADEVVTLSRHVAKQLAERRPRLKAAIKALFHPVLEGEAVPVAAERSEPPLGFLFFGRVMTYKGLPLLVEACERLRAAGLRFRIGVVGEGRLGELLPRLTQLNAEIVNRWTDRNELPAIFARYDAVVVPSIEASQSGVVGLAHGLGLPVIAMPVGGLVEQVEDQKTGLLADEVSAGGLARAMSRWLSDIDLRRRLRSGVMDVRNAHSMRRFYELLTQP